jgi:hypothetical protein
MITPRATLARAVMLLGLCGFWAGLAMACRLFPGEFDWRYMTVSNLFSSRHNPPGHLWGSAGVVFCGVMGLLWVVLGITRPPATDWRDGLRESGLQALGFPLMTLAAALPAQWLIPKGHEWLAVIAFLALCSGLIKAWVQLILERYPRGSAHRRFRAIALAGAVLWPVAGAALTQGYLALFRPELPWVTLAWRAQRVPLLLSFALWEWFTCLTLSACLATLCLSRSLNGSNQILSASNGRRN